MFDKNKFAQILKNINETYNSQRDFSTKSGINRTYLSQYMNMKLEEPPKPKILEKLANASNGITTYAELMFVCGYTNNYMSNSDFNIKNLIFNKKLSDFKKIGLNSEEIEELRHMYIGIPYNNSLTTIYEFTSKFTTQQKHQLDIIWEELFQKELKETEQEFKTKYAKEIEGLTDEEIKMALQFYKEMKKKVKGDN